MRCTLEKIWCMTRFLVCCTHSMQMCTHLIGVFSNSGALVGFTNLGSINAHLCAFEQMLTNDNSCTEQPLAKSMLVLMVRGLFSRLQFPYAQFPCANLKGDQMFHVFWKAVGRLERYGFHVVGLTSWSCCQSSVFQTPRIKEKQGAGAQGFQSLLQGIQKSIVLF